MAAGTALAGLVAFVALPTSPSAVPHASRHTQSVDALLGLPRSGLVAADAGKPGSGYGWEVTSGSLYTRDGLLWSGIPDEGPADPAARRTGSAVLRALVSGSRFLDFTLQVTARVVRLVSTARTPARGYDGLHLFLRYISPQDLYTVDLFRRDGLLTFKRKLPGGGIDGGHYVTLASERDPIQLRAWHTYLVSVDNRHGGVELTLFVDGRQALHCLDRYAHGAISTAGMVGLRGDNGAFEVSAFRITPAP